MVSESCTVISAAIEPERMRIASCVAVGVADERKRSLVPLSVPQDSQSELGSGLLLLRASVLQSSSASLQKAAIYGGAESQIGCNCTVCNTPIEQFSLLKP